MGAGEDELVKAFLNLIVHTCLMEKIENGRIFPGNMEESGHDTACRCMAGEDIDFFRKTVHQIS